MGYNRVMAIIVQKYGGSSVADIEKIQKVATKIVATRRQGYDVVVVVSAMGNTTDELLGMARQIVPNPSRRELDMLLSVGERISIALLSMAIHELGEEAISFTGSQSGIITTHSHSNARIIDVRPFRIQDELDAGNIVIVAGYQGTSYKREITTLGRGGSDTTAVALAGALGAEACEIYSDVDGIFTSDPRVVLDAQQLSEITYEEMLELARHGAKVLNAEAVAFAQRHQVALYARSTHKPESRGTVVRRDGWPDRQLQAARIAPRGVAALAHVLTLSGRSEHEPLALVGQELPGVELLYAECTPHRFELALNPTDIADLEATTDHLARILGDGVEVHHNLCSVTCVGVRIGTLPTWPRQMQSALRDAKLEVARLIAMPNAITALLPAKHKDAAMRAAHTLVEV